MLPAYLEDPVVNINFTYTNVLVPNTHIQIFIYNVEERTMQTLGHVYEWTKETGRTLEIIWHGG